MINLILRVGKFIDVLGNKRGIYFNIKDLELMGYYFCDFFLDYCDLD